MEQGIISGTGQFITIENADGTKKQLEVPEVIHTFAHWKELGYSVKKGEHAVAKFPVWKFKSGKKIEDDTEIIGKDKMFLKMSAFFTERQVEKK